MIYIKMMTKYRAYLFFGHGFYLMLIYEKIHVIYIYNNTHKTI